MSENIQRAHGEMNKELKNVAGDISYAIDGMPTFYVDRSRIAEVLSYLKESADGSFDMLSDLTAVDWLPKPEMECRFELVYHLSSSTLNHRLRIKVKVPENDYTAPTATGVFKAANWMEREVFDMFGISFTGHPDMRRILTWEGFEGHPLRKDFPTRGLRPTERTPET